MATSSRKIEHLDIVFNKAVQFKSKTTGFEKYSLQHCALPEIDFKDIDTGIQFLGKSLSFPLMISGITGGCEESIAINKRLAEACQLSRVALGVGSQRQLIESDDFTQSYKVVREFAPDCVIVGNIGAEEVAKIRDELIIMKMVDTIEADAVAVHLNPLQEILQPEGNATFRGVLQGIECLVKQLTIPIIVKEVGCGLSKSVAERLVDVGVQIIDVAGAGGTSWAGIESYRTDKTKLAERFWDWGIPTAESLIQVASVPGIQVIASGGIDNGVTMAKAIALGASLCGVARPMLMALNDSDLEGLIDLIRAWQEEFQTAMFLTGCDRVEALREKDILNNGI